MADGNIQAFVIGHAIGQSIQTVNNTNTTHLLRVEHVLEDGANGIIDELYDFITEFIPELILVIFIFAIFWGFAVGFQIIWNYMLYGCGCSINKRILTKRVWFLFLIVIGVVAAFGYVGIDFVSIFVTLGVFSGFIMLAVSDIISNIFAGFHIQLINLLENHHNIDFIGQGISGEIKVSGWLHTEILTPADEGANRGAVVRTLIVPNKYFITYPFAVEWTNERIFDKPNSLTRETTHNNVQPKTTQSIYADYQSMLPSEALKNVRKRNINEYTFPSN